MTLRHRKLRNRRLIYRQIDPSTYPHIPIITFRPELCLSKGAGIVLLVRLIAQASGVGKTWEISALTAGKKFHSAGPVVLLLLPAPAPPFFRMKGFTNVQRIQRGRGDGRHGLSENPTAVRAIRPLGGSGHTRHAGTTPGKPGIRSARWPARAGTVSLMSRPSPPKCRGIGCSNDAIGVVGRDPYDHVSWSPLVAPAPYCLNCYNERILDALEFVMREVK